MCIRDSTWEASDKQEYAARTIRKKINGRLEGFLTDFPTLEDVCEAVREAAARHGVVCARALVRLPHTHR